MRIHIKILINLLLILMASAAFGQKDSTRLKKTSNRPLSKPVKSDSCNYENLNLKIDAKTEPADKKYKLNIKYKNAQDSSIWINLNYNTESLKKLSNRRLSKRVISQYCDYENLSFKIDAKIETAKKKYNLNIIYRNVRDSLIWINVNHNTGIPVARLLLSPDSTKMLNRLDKEYLIISNEQIVETFNYDINFDILQSIFVAELINLDPKKSTIQNYKHYKVYIDSSYSMQNIKKRKINRLLKKDKIDEYYIHKVKISPLFKILSMSLEDNIKKQEITIKYSEYDKENQIPKQIDILLGNKNGETKIKLKIRKVKLDKDKLSTSFKIPKKYSKAEIKSPKEK